MEETRSIFLDEVSVGGIFREIWKNLWVIFMGAASITIIGILVMRITYSPKYETETVLAVSYKNNTTNLDTLVATSQMAASYVEIFQGDVLKEIVRVDLGQEELAGKIAASQIEDTNLISLTVTSPNAGEVYRISRSILANYTQVSDVVFDNAVIDVVVDPKIPTEASNLMNMRRWTILLAGGGFILMAALVVIIYIMRDTIKSEKSVEYKLDCKLFSCIGHVKGKKRASKTDNKKAKSILLDSPLVNFSYVETFHKLCTKLEYYMKKEKQKVIMVTSVGENEGKTTVSANLALGWAEKGYRVLVIDGDFRKPSMFKIFESDMEKQQSFSEYLQGNIKFSDSLIHNEKYGVDTLFSTIGYSNSSSLAASSRMKSSLKNLKELYDFIIVDTAPVGILADSEVLADLVDVSLLVIRQDLVASGDINDAVDMLKQSQSHFLGCVLNDYREYHLAVSGYGYGYGAKHYYGKNYSYGSENKSSE